MGIRGYSKHDMIVADESQYSWGGTDYTLLALRSDTSIPTGLSTSDYTGILATGPVTDATFTKTYIIPNVWDVLTIIDGMAEGMMKMAVVLGGTPSPTAYARVTKVELTLKAIDTSGSSRTIQSAEEIWSGTFERLGTSGAGTSTLQFIYWSQITDAIIQSNERLVIDFTLTYSISAPSGSGIRIYSTVDTEETTLTLPFVMS